MAGTLGDLFDDIHVLHAELGKRSTSYAVMKAVLELKLLDPLDQGPAAAEPIAAATGVPVDIVRRLTDYLAAEGVLEIDGEGRISRTPRSDLMRACEASVLMSCMSAEVGMKLAKAITEGGTAFEASFGMPAFEYLEANPAIGEVFGRYMSTTTLVAEESIFSHHRFAPFDLAVDVGGSQGSMILRLLALHPQSRGILFDLPVSIEHAKGPIAASGIDGRVEAIGGSFFESVPAGGDLYLLKQVLHDWSDGESLAILGKVREAMEAGGRLAVIERLIPETHVPHPAWAFDIVMMMWTTGRERRLSEFEALLQAARFRLDRVTENPAGPSVIEAVAV